jgi:hypothetical protein
MTDDREEQIRRLGEAMSSKQQILDYSGLATALYEAGARIPDPPAPTLPVVSDEAVRAFLEASESYVRGRRKVGCEPARDLHVIVGLRAAWPIMLRETAMMAKMEEVIVACYPGAIAYLVRLAIIRALGGEP